MPSRLIEQTSQSGAIPSRLVELATGHTIAAYAALSYCWGEFSAYAYITT